MTIVGLAEDTASSIVIGSWTGATAQSFEGFKPKLTSTASGRKVYSAFTWSPAQTGSYTLCLDLLNAAGSLMHTRCVIIRVLICQHVMRAGESLESVASIYKVSWRTLWWLNPSLAHPTDVKGGDLINIGRTYTVRSGETLEYTRNTFDSTWFWIRMHNPKKIFYPPVVSVDYMNYKTTSTYSGVEYCVVAEIDYIE